MSTVHTIREHELARIVVGRGEFLTLRDVTYSGKAGRRLDLRKFYTDESGALKPTTKSAGRKAEWTAELHKALDAFEACK